jgi:hypothetical protein
VPVNWDITTNLFETTTRRRFAVMDTLIRDHAARCAAHAGRETRDPELATISARATAACTSWEIAYLHWRTSRSTQRGRTHGVRELLKDLRGKRIALWQVMVQNTEIDQRSWLKGTPGFASLFPAGRRPFQQGSIDSRIAAVATLAGRLAQIPSMAPVTLLVRTFLDEVTNARRSQQHEGSSREMRAAAVEVQRCAAALVLYKNMARLMEKYAEAPNLILTFFDLTDLKKPPRGTGAAAPPP